MSFEAAAWAIKQSTKLPTEKLILIALADCHNRDTKRCDPSLLTLAEIALCSDRTAMRSIESLEKQGLISCEKSTGKRTKYTLNIGLTADADVTPDKMTPVSPVTPTPDTHVTTPLTPMSPEPVRTSNKPVSNTLEIKFSDEDLQFAEWFYGLVLKVAPKAKKPNMNSWAETIRKTRELDKLSHRELAIVFKWANSNHFWSTNILSPEKFRKQFARLDAESKKTRPAGNLSAQEKRSARNAEIFDYDKATTF